LGDLEFALAQEAFDHVEQLASQDAAMLVLLGQQYHRLRRLDQARAAFEQAVRAEPASTPARLSLAAWYERERRLGDALACIDECLSREPRNARVLCVRALLLHRLDRDTEAESVLRDVIAGGAGDANVKFSCRHLLAVVLDAGGQYAEAIDWLRQAKDLARGMANTAQMERDYDHADAQRRALLAALTPDDLRRWRSEAPASPLPHPLVLLGGHPRSGTTLLEQILGAHPGVLAFDEPEAFAQEIWNKLAPLQKAPTQTAAELNALSISRRAEFRRRYLKSLWREVRQEPSGQLLLDKNPSPTTALHLWLRIFPELKVLIALRDPNDVVISCYFQNLMLTPTNVNFLSLERTARHYANLMDVWLRLRELGGFDWIESRYEDLVADPESEGRRVTGFLGLSWDARQAKYHESARNKFLFAPTFTEVAQPVHPRAVGRWRHYTEVLAPIQPQLAPYRAAFGY
jgi:tetratricopeptide (TPR) repeat protein